MTSDDIALRIQADLAPTWPRNRPLPHRVVAEICEALWQEGISPNRRIVQQRMPVWNDHAFGPGIVAWRKEKGLPEQGISVPYALPTNLSELAKIISPAIARAPLTCCDTEGDGRWQVPSVRVLSYLGRIENPSVRDAMALFALLRADRQQKSIYNQMASFVQIEICDAFWPYEKGPKAEATQDRASYIAHIRRLMGSRRCVASSFAPADVNLANVLFQRGVPLQQIERGFLLGCARKYATLLNSQSNAVIVAFSYFQNVIEEAGELQMSDYWRYLQLRIDKMERQWLSAKAS